MTKARNDENSGKIFFRYNLRMSTREEKQISHSIYFLFIINIYMKPSESEQNKEELCCESRNEKIRKLTTHIICIETLR